MRKTMIFTTMLILNICLLLLTNCSKPETGIENIDTTLSGPHWEGALLDPYEILNKHYEAIGGLENVKNNRTSYLEGNITIVGSGLDGTFKQWKELPLKNREEVDLTIFKQISGDNGEFSWSVDMNGKLQIDRDVNTLNERKITKLLAEFDHLNKDSENFILTFLGVDTANGFDCFVIETKNNINDDVNFDYYDTSNYLLVKKIEVKPSSETHTIYSDYREVDSVLYSFHQEAEILPIKQKYIVETTKFEINIEIDSMIFQPPEGDVVDFKFDNGKSAENIPFRFIEDHIYLNVNINGEDGLWILDCGASASVISTEYAEELGLELQGSITGQGAGNTVEVSFTTLPPFSISGLKFDEQNVIAISIQPFMEKLSRLDVCGILGYDFLSRFVTKINYANELISFYLPDSFKYKGEGLIIDSPLEDNMFIVPMSVDDEYSGMWRLDIGATGLGFHYPFAKENNLLEIKSIETISFGAGGEIPGRRAKFKFVTIGDFVVYEPEISIPIDIGSGAFDDKRYIGNLGNTVLRHFVLYLDYQNQRIILEKGANYEKEFPRAKSGMAIWDTEEGVEIFFISPGSPSDKAGLKEGDIILSINGKNIEKFETLVEIRDLYKSDEGTELILEIKREDEIISIILVLEELY